MSETFIVLKREFLERVRGKGFWIGTLVLPLFMAGMTILPTLLNRGGSAKTIVLVDEAPAGVAAQVVAGLTRPDEDGKPSRYRVERAAGPFAGVRESLNRRVLDKEIDGYVYLPADVVQRNTIEYRARNVSNLQVAGDIRRAVSQAVQASRLQGAGLQVGEVAALLRPVEVNSARVTAQGEKAGNAVSAFFLSYIVGFVVYFLVFLYGFNVMRSVLEEKTNRIVEVVVSSMKASHLMLGKILGVGAVAMLQVALWVVAGMAISRLGGRMGMPQGALSNLGLSAGVVTQLVVFFILGFFLFAALFAALGAAVNSEQEAQQYQTVVFLPLIVPMLFITQIVGDPLGTTATVLGLIPLTAPVTMPMRLTATSLPAWQIAASLVGIAVTVVLVAWLAGKIYRVGILSTGKKPTLGELIRWLRMA
jgi:ABC-2 type transport system permease protein